MNYLDLVAIGAVMQLLWFSALVARARNQYGVKAPAVTGHELFERLYRVQMNTLELLVAFLPALYLAGKYWDQDVVAGVGAVHLLGRIIAWRAYSATPGKRAVAFVLSALAIAGLLLAALLGVVLAEG